MGSGAFLVAACRYLAARLLEAWTAEATPSRRRRPAARQPSTSAPLPADPLEREALAHRLVAERCLYGVDKNPMAVEMAKLSLWLITLAKDRPFSFVDHALRAGDSLLGITDLRQLRVAHLDPSWHRQASLDLGFGEIEAAVDRALALRRELEAFVVRDVRDAERKAALLAEADAALDDARLLGDLVVGAALAAARRRRPARRDRGRRLASGRCSTTRRPSSTGWPRGRSCGRSPTTGSSSAARAVGEVAGGRVGRPRPVPLGARVPRGQRARRVRRDRRQPAVPGRQEDQRRARRRSTATTSSSGSPAASAAAPTSSPTSTCGPRGCCGRAAASG